MPSCGPNCLIITHPIGDIPPRPVLVRSTHRICQGCRSRNTSDYDHRFCYFCAPANSPEFIYHHRNCENTSAPFAPGAPRARL